MTGQSPNRLVLAKQGHPTSWAQRSVELMLLSGSIRKNKVVGNDRTQVNIG